MYQCRKKTFLKLRKNIKFMIDEEFNKWKVFEFTRSFTTYRFPQIFPNIFQSLTKMRISQSNLVIDRVYFVTRIRKKLSSWRKYSRKAMRSGIMASFLLFRYEKTLVAWDLVTLSPCSLFQWSRKMRTPIKLILIIVAVGFVWDQRKTF